MTVSVLFYIPSHSASVVLKIRAVIQFLIHFYGHDLSGRKVDRLDVANFIRVNVSIDPFPS